jgi:hypothetical protein
MFTKLKPRQEQFLWLVLEGVPQQRAYAEVYGQHLSENSCAASASKMLTVPKVIQRRNEIIAAKAARQPMTAEFLTRELVAVAGESRALGQGSAAVAAFMGIAKIQGLIIDRVQSDVLVRKPSATPESPDDMSPEEWLGEYTLTIDHEPQHEPHNNGLSEAPKESDDLAREARSLGLVEPEP